MNAELRKELLEMAENDLATRARLSAEGELHKGYDVEMESVHLANARRLEAIIRRHGWPGSDLVGDDGSEAAWLIVQHAISLPEFVRRCLEELGTAVNEGRALPSHYAHLYDRIAFFEGRPQRYGTQSDWDALGQMRVWKLEDEARVNQFRREAELPPLESLVRDAGEIGEEPPADPDERIKQFLDWARETGWREA